MNEAASRLTRPPVPGTSYRLWLGSETHFTVTRVIQTHPEYWVLELRGLHRPALRAEVVILRDLRPSAPGG